MRSLPTVNCRAVETRCSYETKPKWAFTSESVRSCEIGNQRAKRDSRRARKQADLTREKSLGNGDFASKTASIIWPKASGLRTSLWETENTSTGQQTWLWTLTLAHSDLTSTGVRSTGQLKTNHSVERSAGLKHEAVIDFLGKGANTNIRSSCLIRKSSRIDTDRAH